MDACAFAPMHDHAATEAVLAESGLAWIALRNGFYASAVPRLAGDAATSGLLAAAQDGKVCWTTHRDLAEAAAVMLTSEGSFSDPTPPLTAAEALDLADVADLMSDLCGRPVLRQVISDQEQAARMAEGGAPPEAVEITLGLFRAARASEFAAFDPALTGLLYLSGASTFATRQCGCGGTGSGRCSPLTSIASGSI